MADTLNALQLDVVHKTDDAVKGIDNLITSLVKLRKACEGGAGLNDLVGGLKNANKAFSEFTTDKGSNISRISSAFKRLTKNVSTTGTSFDGLKQSAHNAFESIKDVQDNIANTDTLSFSTGVKAQDKTAYSTPKLDVGYSSETIDESTEEVGKLSEAFEKFRAKAVESCSKVGSSLRGLKKETKDAHKPFSTLIEKASKLFNSFKRIAMYRIAREIIKEISAGIRDGIGNLYEWSRLNDGQFSASMDKLATEMLYLKNAVGASLSPVIQALVPVIERVVDAFVELINKVQQVFSVLTGRDYWYKAIKKQTQFKETADKTTKALHAQLMGFDEINNITTPSSGGSDNGNDADGMFELIKQPINGISDKLVGLLEKFKNLFSKIKSGFTSLWNFILPRLKHIWELIIDIGSAILDAFGEDTTGLLKSLWEDFIGFVDSGLQIIEGALEVILGILKGDTQTVLFGLIDMVSGTIKSIVNICFGIVTAVVDILMVIWNSIVTLIKKPTIEMLNEFKIIFQGLADVFGWQWAQKVADSIDSTIKKADSWGNNIQGNLNKFNDATNDTRNKWISAIDAMTNKAKAAISSYASYGRESGAAYWNNFAASARAASANSPVKTSAISANNTTKLINRIALMADGGFVSQGSLFVAGEVGGQAEMVGNINGRTGVVSGNEISGIGEAVYSTGETNAMLLRQLINVVVAKDLTISPSSSFGAVAQKSLRLYNGVTG